MIATNIVDDNTKVITKITGKGDETKENVLKVSTLKNATSEPIVSIGNLHYEILPTDNKITLSFGDTEAIELSGRGNYGMKPNENKIETTSTKDVFLTSEKEITGYNIVMECYKETGFSV